MINEPTKWKYTDSSNEVVERIYPDGRTESCLVTSEDVQAWIAEGNTPEAAEFNQTQQPIPTLTRTQLMLALLGAGYITEAEAVATTALPADMVAMLDALNADSATRTNALIRWGNFTTVERSDFLVTTYATYKGLTETQLDDFFRNAGVL